MDNNPDPEKLFRMLGEAGRAIALDDIDDVGDGFINDNTPVPLLESAPHHWTIGCGLMLLANGGREAIQQKQMQMYQQQVSHHQSNDLVEQLSEVLE